MADRIQIRRGTANEAAAANPILADGEPGWDKTNNLIKIGDGVTEWDELDSVAPCANTFMLSALEKSVSQVNFNTFESAGGYIAGSRRISSGALNDEVVFELPFRLHGGTWHLTMMHSVSSASGKAHVDVSTDGSTWTSNIAVYDFYSGSTTNASRSEASGVVLPVGARYFRFRMASKSASNVTSSYIGRIHGFTGRRTGA